MTLLELNRASLGDQVYELLKNTVLRGDFSPGQRLSPQELSERFQLSVTPVRDALRRLEADGLVQVSPRRGTFVAQFSAGEVKEVFESRIVIEAAAAEKLPTAPITILQRMSKLVDNMETLIDGENVLDYSHYLKLDEEFHDCIVAIMRNNRLSEFHHSLRAYTFVARALVPSVDRRMPQTHLEHRQILEAFQLRDVVKAKLAITTHLDNGMNDILRKITQIPDGAGEEKGREDYPGQENTA